MGMPIDIKGVLGAVSDAEQDRSMPVGVQVYFDAAVPADLRAVMEEAFATEAENAHVAFSEYRNGSYDMPQVNADLAVIAAGPDSSTGKLYAALHDAGYPALVVTTCPSLVKKLADLSGDPIEEGDVVCSFNEGEFTETEEPVSLEVTGVARLQVSVGSWLMDIYPEKRLAFASAFTFLRRSLAMDAVNATSIQNGGIGLVTILPGADMPLMTMNQVKMLLQIAAAYGEEIGAARAKEIAGVVGTGFACRSVARTLVGLVPALGPFLKAGVGYAGTQAMGLALVEYFEDGGDVAKFANRAVSAAKDVASGKRKISIPIDANDLKRTVVKAVDVTTKFVIPTAKDMGQVLAKNGLDTQRIASAAGVVTETVVSSALGAIRK